MTHFAVAHLEKTAGALLPLATTLGGAAIGGLLGGAAGQDQMNRADDFQSAQALQHAAPGAGIMPTEIHRVTDPMVDNVVAAGNAIIRPAGDVNRMFSGAAGGSALGAGAGLAGGLLMDSRDRRAAAAEPKFAAAHLQSLVAKAR